MKKLYRSVVMHFTTQKRVVVWTLILTLLFAALEMYLLRPALNLKSSGFWWYILFILLIASVSSLLFSGFHRKVRNDTNREEPNTFRSSRSMSFHEWETSQSNPIRWNTLKRLKNKINVFMKRHPIPAIFIAILTLWILIFFFTSIPAWQVISAYQYADVVTIEHGNFQEDITKISQDSMIIVDVDTARRLGDRTLGNLQNATWYEADDEYNLVSINGVYYRISPVNYGNDLFKWHAARQEGIPGYILVNANTQEANLVPLSEGMKYSPSAFFGDNLYRHLRWQYPSHIFGKAFFEVDDDGTPYWITGVYKTTVGLRGAPIVKSAVITNAVTGVSEEYTIENLPEWVDHVFSVSDLMTYIGWHYRYSSHGYFNLSNTGVYRTSYYYKNEHNNEDNEHTPFVGYNSVVTKDGRVMFYTGITPANTAETIIGFVLASPRTGEVVFYEVSGAEESSAQTAAEGLRTDLLYSASFPTIVNVGGHETYFMTLKDKGGLVQRYALSNVKHYDDVVEASTLDEAIAKYLVKIGGTSSYDPDQTLSVSGIVKNVQQAQIGGYTYYYFTLGTGADLVYMSSIQNSNMQPMELKAGAKVSLDYYLSADENGIGIVTEIRFR